MLAPVPAVELELDPLIAEARRRARRRRFLWACVVGIAAVAAGVVALRNSGRPGFMALAPPDCNASQLRLALRSGGVGNLGTAAYAVTLRNTSNATCTLSGWPKLRLVMSGGARVTRRPHDLIAFAYSVKHPPPAPRIRLGPGGSAQWYFQAADGTGLHHACRTAEKLLVVPPAEHQSLALAVRVPFCGPHYFWELPIGRSP
jgi:uncharacterized protein DUF4232